MKGEQLPQIPKNYEAERSVLEVIFAAPERLGEAAEILNPHDFHHSLYGKIFMAALRLETERRQIDPITIAQLLSGDGELQMVGGVTFLCTLGDLAHKRAALPEYCRIVKEAAQRRQLQHILNHANNNLNDSEISNNEIEERIEVGLSDLREEGAGRSAMHVADIVREIGPILDRVVSGIWIDDRPAISALELRWRLRSLAQRHSIKFAVVDYLQLLRAKAENRTQEITKISMELKAAARELGEISGGTLLAISQLNRMAAKERPQLHHLRESGQIEQDADTVLLLYDAELMALGQSDPNSKILEVVKQRNGPCGHVPLTFLPAVMGFEPASPEYEFEDHKSAAVGEDR